MFFAFMKMPIICDTTFYSYQCSFILKGINRFFQAEQVERDSIVFDLNVFLQFVGKGNPTVQG